MQEIWKVVNDFSNYEVSNLGRVRNIRTNRIIKTNTRQWGGYEAVALYSTKTGKYTTMRVHRLVAMAFVDNPDHKSEVDHINRNKLDSRACNLRWATRSENMLNRDFCRPVMKFNNGKLVNFYKDMTSAALDIMISQDRKSLASIQVAICQVCSKKRNKAYGYSWEYGTLEDYYFYKENM